MHLEGIENFLNREGWLVTGLALGAEGPPARSNTHLLGRCATVGGSLGGLAACHGAGACPPWFGWQGEWGHHRLGVQSSLNAPPHSAFSSSCPLPATGLRWTGLHQGMLVAKSISSIFFSKPLCPPGQARRQLQVALACGRELASPLRKLGAGPAGPFACRTPWAGCVGRPVWLGASWAPTFLTLSTGEPAWHTSRAWV